MTTRTRNNTDLSGTAQFDPPGTPPAIGVIAPFDFALDDEYWRWLPAGVNLCVTRTPYLDLPVSIEMAEAVSSLPDITAAARALSAVSPAAVLYACTSGSFVDGVAGERALRAAISDAAGAPAVTPSGALLDALNAAGARTLAIGTPYDAAVTGRLAAFLAEAGHATASGAFLGLRADIARVDAATVRRLARAADSPGADALFLSCTNLRTFGVRHQGGRLTGRGVADTKGGLAAAALAMAALAAHGVALAGPLVLAAVADEEEHSIGARDLGADLAGHDLRGAIVVEPTNLQTVVAARGDCYLNVELAGRAAHSGDPSAGANAIYGAASVVRAVQAMHAEAAASPHPLLGPATWSVGQVAGGTGTSVVPASCRLAIDRRLLPGQSAAAACRQLETAIAGSGLPDGVTATARVVMEMPGFETPTDDPLVAALQAAAVDAGGPDLPVAGWSAACDGGFIARDHHLPTLVFGPGSVVDQAHQADESVPIADLVTAARAYALSALRLGADRA